MQQLALGCTTDAHQLYPLYMSRMSACIFEWDAADLALLREAKAQQLQAQGPSSADVDRHLTREELALHCRRRTRGVTTTVKLLEELLDVLMGSRGNDSLGVPLFDQERMEHISQVQRKHVKCIQDPLGVALYMNPDSEDSARLVEEHDALVNEEDEGFSELSADPTVLDMEVSPSTSSMLSEAGDTSNETMAVDDQNVPGYQHVDRLAEYLVELREQISLCLNNLQADSITELWLRLDDEERL
ncbi:hypothetical protein AMECASPLE_035928 [Ameca splendens]|uniref:Uncharacterized protein n=1 Tax=Ameca splendens TaxID=208324 RepID=A0ABV0ZTE8_9TELE